MNQITIPDNWYNLPEEEVKQYVEYLLQNYKSCKLNCTPYDKKDNTGLDVKISGPNFAVNIRKLCSPKYKRGGHATQGWIIYGCHDYGYSYDGYHINGIDVFINQQHEIYPNIYPMQDPLYKKVHKLYLAVRAETIPTYEQQAQIEEQKATQEIEKNAQLALLQTMQVQGAISKVIYDQWVQKIKS